MRPPATGAADLPRNHLPATRRLGAALLAKACSARQCPALSRSQTVLDMTEMACLVGARRMQLVQTCGALRALRGRSGPGNVDCKAPEVRSD